MIRKLRWLGYGIAFAVLYLILGATAPFVRYKEISQETKDQVAEKLAGEQAKREQWEAVSENGAAVDRAMLLETNQSAWEERIRLLNEAKESIILSTFDMREGESTKDLLSVMLKKAEEGVSVKILVDGISGMIRMEGEPLFYAVSSHPNVEIKLYNRLNLLTPWKSQGRMHDKYVIVDDMAYILGGRNCFDYFIGTYPANSRSYDREVLIYNQAHGTKDGQESSLYELKAYFDQVWNLQACTLFHNEAELGEKQKVQEQAQLLEERYASIAGEYPKLFETPDYAACTVETKGVSLISNPIGLYGKEPVVFYELTQRMQQARESVVLHTPYAVCNDYMLETLEEVKEKVPSVTLMLNAVENGDNFMASSDYIYNKKKLLKTGITFLEYDGGTSYHGKSMVLDKKTVFVGSYNLDLRSSYVDTELMLAVESRELAEELLGYMEDYHHDSRLVTGEKEYELPEHLELRKAPLWKRAAWRVVGLLMQPFRFLV